ncbi:hypothetical protein GON09_003138 [Rhodococcus sp. B50]|nr:hypothetical protein [Rhodococcus sp. B50]
MSYEIVYCNYENSILLLDRVDSPASAPDRPRVAEAPYREV